MPTTSLLAGMPASITASTAAIRSPAENDVASLFVPNSTSPWQPPSSSRLQNSIYAGRSMDRSAETGVRVGAKTPRSESSVIPLFLSISNRRWQLALTNGLLHVTTSRSALSNGPVPALLQRAVCLRPIARTRFGRALRPGRSDWSLDRFPRNFFAACIK